MIAVRGFMENRVVPTDEEDRTWCGAIGDRLFDDAVEDWRAAPIRCHRWQRQDERKQKCRNSFHAVESNSGSARRHSKLVPRQVAQVNVFESHAAFTPGMELKCDDPFFGRG